MVVRWRFLALLAVCELLAACGRSTRNGRNDPASGTGGSAGSGSSGGSGQAGVAGQLSGSGGGGAPAAASHGPVPLHRLRGVEYANSVRDLLGIEASAPEPDAAKPYDAVIKDAAPWVEAISLVAEQLLDSPELPEHLPCVPMSDADRSCALAVIKDLGLRAFRRPLRETEQSRLAQLYDEVSQVDGGRVALEQVVRALLLSPEFLFHVEPSDEPDGQAPELLDSYALASRLSFALWSTTPDPQLLEAAAADLTGDDALSSAYERLAQNPRSAEVADGLNSVWLGMDQLEAHAVDTSAFPGWSWQVRQDMADSQRQLMRAILSPGPPLSRLLTLDLGQPNGLLGEPAVLTLTSTDRRTSATRRGTFIVERLLCRQLPPPHPDISSALGADYPTGQSERGALEALTKDAPCAACHGLFDPFGLALGNYDAIGQFRTIDSQGYPVDTHVELPAEVLGNSVVVGGLNDLNRALADSSLFHACAAQQVASYLIHRPLSSDTDPDLLEPLGADVATGATLGDILRTVVMSDQFRYRRLPAN